MGPTHHQVEEKLNDTTQSNINENSSEDINNDEQINCSYIQMNEGQSNNNTFKCICTNADVLTNKMAELKLRINEEMPALIGINEVKQQTMKEFDLITLKCPKYEIIYNESIHQGPRGGTII